MHSRILLLLALCSLMTACGVGGQIGHGMKLYSQGRYDHAMKTWTEVAPKEEDMNEKGLVRYLVYRGLTHQKLGQRTAALKFLQRGKKAYVAGKPGWLTDEIQEQMKGALAALQGGTPRPQPPAAPPSPTPPAKPRPAPPPAAKPTPRGIQPIKRGTVIAMFDLEDASEQLSSKELDQLGDYLAAQLTAKAGLKIVPRSQLRKRLAEGKRESFKRCFDESCQIELGKAVAAQKSLATKLLRVGDTCAITAVLYDLRTETTEGAATVDTQCSPNALMGGMRQIANRFAGTTD